MPTAPRKWVGNVFGLSPIEVESLQELSNGVAPREICGKRKQTMRAFYGMMYLVRVKMDALTTTEAVAIGIRRGIID